MILINLLPHREAARKRRRDCLVEDQKIVLAIQQRIKRRIEGKKRI